MPQTQPNLDSPNAQGKSNPNANPPITSETVAGTVDKPDPEPTHGLPSPREFPNSDVVIYDGRCVFCESQVRNLVRLDGKNRLAFISLHDQWVGEHFPDLTFDQMMEQIYLIPASEHGYSDSRHGGAAAIRYLTRRLPLLWILAPLMHIPFTLPIWQWGYRQIAKRRYKIAGKQGMQCDEDGTCELHFGDKK